MTRSSYCFPTLRHSCLASFSCVLWPEDPGRGKPQGSKDPITDVIVVSCKTGRALWARLRFSVGGFLCSFPRQWTTLGIFPKRATCNLPFLYSAVPAKSGFVKMVSEVPGVYVYNRVKFWIQRIIKRLFTRGILECCGEAGQFPSARDCPMHCRVTRTPTSSHSLSEAALLPRMTAKLPPQIPGNSPVRSCPALIETSSS